MSISALDNQYSLGRGVFSPPVLPVRTIKENEIPFSMPATDSSQASNITEKNSNYIQQKGTDSTGIILSEEMKAFLAELPENKAKNSKFTAMPNQSNSLPDTYSRGFEKSNSSKVAEFTEKTTLGNDLSAQPILNTVGLMMNVNPTLQQEGAIGVTQSQAQSANYIPFAESSIALQPIDNAESFQQARYRDNAHKSYQRMQNIA